MSPVPLNSTRSGLQRFTSAFFSRLGLFEWLKKGTSSTESARSVAAGYNLVTANPRQAPLPLKSWRTLSSLLSRDSEPEVAPAPRAVKENDPTHSVMWRPSPDHCGADHRFLWSALHPALDHVHSSSSFAMPLARDHPRSSDQVADHKKRWTAPLQPGCPSAKRETRLTPNSATSGVRRFISALFCRARPRIALGVCRQAVPSEPYFPDSHDFSAAAGPHWRYRRFTPR